MSNLSIDTGAQAARPGDTVEIIRRLRQKLENHRRRRARQAGWIPRFIPTGLNALDTVLPHGGLPCGAITEILSDEPGAGAMSLSLRIAAQSILEWPGQGRVSHPLRGWGTNGHPIPSDGGRRTFDDHRCLVLVDTTRDFYPPAAWQYGIAFDRLIVIRTNHGPEAFWAVDQSLRCQAVAAVIVALPQLDERRSRRLQLAAKSSGCLGLILRSARGRTRSFAAVRILIDSVPDANLFFHEDAMDEQRGGMAKLDSVGYPIRSGGGGRMNQAGWPTSSEMGDSIQTSHLTCSSPPNIFIYQGGIEEGCRTIPYLCRLTLLTVREGMPVGPLWVDLHHETGAVPVHPVPVDRSAAKTG